MQALMLPADAANPPRFNESPWPAPHPADHESVYTRLNNLCPGTVDHDLPGTSPLDAEWLEAIERGKAHWANRGR
jgi:hypothetical protein